MQFLQKFFLAIFIGLGFGLIFFGGINICENSNFCREKLDSINIESEKFLIKTLGENSNFYKKFLEKKISIKNLDKNKSSPKNLDEKILDEKNEKNFRKTNIWKNLWNWDFNPINLINLKQKIWHKNIWENDENILRFVNPENPLTNINYRPKDLVSIEWKYINQAGRSSQIRQIAKESLDELSKNFYENFGEPLVAISGFRSAEYQQRLWDLGRCDDGAFCAKPGFSEHQLGLAIDFFDATNENEYLTNPRYKKFVTWMKKNAHKYGWTQSYKHWPQMDGYEIEPWHWRFVGVEMANILYKLDMSYSKYLKWQKNIESY